jgi:hypothetical protein
VVLVVNAPAHSAVIPSFPDYAATEAGEIVRVVPDQRNHALSGQPLAATPNHAGYPELTLCRDGKPYNVRVNRAICEAFHGCPPTAEYHAAHLNGNRSDNSPANLAWKMPVANEADKVGHGTSLRGDRHWSRRKPECRAVGEGHGRSKLTADAVRAIRDDRRAQREIAADHGVSQRAVWMIKQGKTWGHVA